MLSDVRAFPPVPGVLLVGYGEYGFTSSVDEPSLRHRLGR